MFIEIGDIVNYTRLSKNYAPQTAGIIFRKWLGQFDTHFFQRFKKKNCDKTS